ncbi:MAG: hypothetical protein NW217_14385 [Hyphomicrobiaceae bacterium]|nr:hypothetical protein [Hyphomicrobiaceae bacterium]
MKISGFPPIMAESNLIEVGNSRSSRPRRRRKPKRRVVRRPRRRVVRSRSRT